MTPRSADPKDLLARAKIAPLALDAAFPLWWQVGADHVGSGWHERTI